MKKLVLHHSHLKGTEAINTETHTPEVERLGPKRDALLGPEGEALLLMILQAETWAESLSHNLPTSTFHMG